MKMKSKASVSRQLKLNSKSDSDDNDELPGESLVDAVPSSGSQKTTGLSDSDDTPLKKVKGKINQVLSSGSESAGFESDKHDSDSDSANDFIIQKRITRATLQKVDLHAKNEKKILDSDNTDSEEDFLKSDKKTDSRNSDGEIQERDCENDKSSSSEDEIPLKNIKSSDNQQRRQSKTHKESPSTTEKPKANNRLRSKTNTYLISESEDDLDDLPLRRKIKSTPRRQATKAGDDNGNVSVPKENESTLNNELLIKESTRSTRRNQESGIDDDVLSKRSTRSTPRKQTSDNEEDFSTKSSSNEQNLKKSSTSKERRKRRKVNDSESSEDADLQSLDENEPTLESESENASTSINDLPSKRVMRSTPKKPESGNNDVVRSKRSTRSNPRKQASETDEDFLSRSSSKEPQNLKKSLRFKDRTKKRKVNESSEDGDAQSLDEHESVENASTSIDDLPSKRVMRSTPKKTDSGNKDMSKRRTRSTPRKQALETEEDFSPRSSSKEQNSKKSSTFKERTKRRKVNESESSEDGDAQSLDENESVENASTSIDDLLSKRVMRSTPKKNDSGNKDDVMSKRRTRSTPRKQASETEEDFSLRSSSKEQNSKKSSKFKERTKRRKVNESESSEDDDAQSLDENESVENAFTSIDDLPSKRVIKSTPKKPEAGNNDDDMSKRSTRSTPKKQASDAEEDFLPGSSSEEQNLKKSLTSKEQTKRSILLSDSSEDADLQNLDNENEFNLESDSDLPDVFDENKSTQAKRPTSSDRSSAQKSTGVTEKGRKKMRFDDELENESGDEKNDCNSNDSFVKLTCDSSENEVISKLDKSANGKQITHSLLKTISQRVPVVLCERFSTHVLQEYGCKLVGSDLAEGSEGQSNPQESDSDLSSTTSGDENSFEYQEIEKRQSARVKSQPRKRNLLQVRKEDGDYEKGPDVKDRRIYRLQRYIRLAGLQVNHSQLRECRSKNAKIRLLLSALENAGLKGKPTIRSCTKLKKKRAIQLELEELDTENIPITKGRSMRSSVSAEQTIASHHTPAKKIFSRLKDIVESSEESS